VLIDEGHDFAPEWLKLAAQMVDPATNSLLLLYDDAQSIYERARTAVQLQEPRHPGPGPHDDPEDQLPQHPADPADRQPGRRRPADRSEDSDDDGIPLVQPVSCGRDGARTARHPPAEPCATKPSRSPNC
jgi:hypothetical protein